ncbi:MAG: hypothetical protein MI700_10805 [Balneolales bacterium]|nr:hypothetical protein [Balneolales bacterium]
MKLKHLYITGLAIMLMMNGVLIFMMLQKPASAVQQQPPSRHESPAGLKNKILNELQFSTEQMQQFDRLTREHRQAIREIEGQQKEAATSYFNSLKNEAVDIEQQLALLEELKEFEGRKLQLTYTHFSDLKEICTPEQRAKFGVIVDDMLLVLLGPRNNQRPPPPRPRGF